MCSLLTRADEAWIVLFKLQNCQKQRTGNPGKSRRSVSLWTFCKGFEDWLDLKCNLNEMVEVHVSRDRFIHTHFAPTCCLFTLDYNSKRVKETLIRILSLKTGFFGVSITFLTFCAFWNGWNNFFVPAVRCQNDTFVHFIHKILLYHL